MVTQFCTVQQKKNTIARPHCYRVLADPKAKKPIINIIMAGITIKKYEDLKNKYKNLVAKLKEECDAHGRLKADYQKLKAEKEQLETEGTAAEQVELTNNQVRAVMHVVNAQYFKLVPLIDKVLFEKSRLLVPVGKALGMEKGPTLLKYAEAIKKAFVAKTIQRREYLTTKVRVAYLGKSIANRQ